MTDNDFRTTFARAELDTDLWVVAWDGDRVAGVVQTWVWGEENERLGVSRGWLEHISVRRPWRRRGLGRAITAASLVKLREHGLTDRNFGELHGLSFALVGRLRVALATGLTGSAGLTSAVAGVAGGVSSTSIEIPSI